MNKAFAVNDHITVRNERGEFTGQVTFIGKRGEIRVETKIFHLTFNASDILAKIEDKFELETNSLTVIPMVGSAMSSTIELIANTKYLQRWQKLALAVEYSGEYGVQLLKYKLGEI